MFVITKNKKHSPLFYPSDSFAVVLYPHTSNKQFKDKAYVLTVASPNRSPSLDREKKLQI